MSKRNTKTPRPLPEVHFSEDGQCRYLHLGQTPWVQGSMWLDKPFDIELEYVQRMMAWLLFTPEPQVKGGHAMQLGLGAGTLTKFCLKKLRMTCTVAELNPAVLHACRGWFHLPADGPRLKVMVEDAHIALQDSQWWGTVDVLQVDLYDQEAAAPVLDSPGFYADCRRVLSDQGCMTVNLFGRNAQFDTSVANIAEAFGEAAVWLFKPTREGNAVVLAQRSASRPKREALLTRASEIEALHGLPARKWLRVFKPLLKV
jgi:spermidine synthase